MGTFLHILIRRPGRTDPDQSVISKNRSPIRDCRATYSLTGGYGSESPTSSAVIQIPAHHNRNSTLPSTNAVVDRLPQARRDNAASGCAVHWASPCSLSAVRKICALTPRSHASRPITPERGRACWTASTRASQRRSGRPSTRYSQSRLRLPASRERSVKALGHWIQQYD